MKNRRIVDWTIKLLSVVSVMIIGKSSKIEAKSPDSIGSPLEFENYFPGDAVGYVQPGGIGEEEYPIIRPE